jgi:uncharacterized protein (DUF433 family)
MVPFSDLKPSGTAHIYLDDRGRGWIDDTGMRVDTLVAKVLGPDPQTPAELLEEYPYLTLARIHAALTWYYDHQAEMDAQTERELRMVEEAREKQKDSPIRQKVRAYLAAREAEATNPK